jgi:K+ transporter
VAITPAIPLLSALEGLELILPSLSVYVLPVTLGILVALFMVQRHGTARVATLFDPICVARFAPVLPALVPNYLGQGGKSQLVPLRATGGSTSVVKGYVIRPHLQRSSGYHRLSTSRGRSCTGPIRGH